VLVNKSVGVKMRSPRIAPKPSFAKLSIHTKKQQKLAKPVQFEVGQKVVYPGHGVGQVQSIESKEIAGAQISFYMIRILESDVMVMVPTTKTDKVRPVATTDEVKEVYSLLKDKKVVVEQSTWNRRYREYMEKVRTGSIFEIAEVLRDLCVIRADKVLSFGERKMLELAKGLLVKELAISEGTDEPTVEAQIESIYVK
jgi:CarD family transcriptional regulator